MKRILFFFLIIFSIYSLSAQEEQSQTIKYDSVLAKSLGADKIGMKKYVLAFLKRGSVKLTDSTEKANLQKAHMDNIKRLANMGKLVVAGPFMDNGDLRGIFLFDCETLEEAKTLTETDPAIKAGTLIMELHPWYGSAALMKVPEIHKKINSNFK